VRDLTLEGVEANPGPLTWKELETKLSKRYGDDFSEVKPILAALKEKIKTYKQLSLVDPAHILEYFNDKNILLTREEEGIAGILGETINTSSGNQPTGKLPQNKEPKIAQYVQNLLKKCETHFSIFPITQIAEASNNTCLVFGTICSEKVIVIKLHNRRQEVILLRQLFHPNVVFVHASVISDRAYLMVQDYLLSENPDTLLSLHKQSYQFVKCILRALMYIHSRKVLHRNIKPDNILFNPGTKKWILCNFDCATVLHSGVCTEIGIGSSGFQAPEVLKVHSGYSTPADMWSFGITIKQKFHPKKGKVKELVDNLTSQHPEDRMSAIDALSFITS